MIVVAPAHIGALYEGQEFNGITVGIVVYEREGVPDRRGYVSHPFDEDRLREILQSNGHLGNVSFVDRVPRDWRWPDVGLARGSE